MKHRIRDPILQIGAMLALIACFAFMTKPVIVMAATSSPPDGAASSALETAQEAILQHWADISALNVIADGTNLSPTAIATDQLSFQTGDYGSSGGIARHVGYGTFESYMATGQLNGMHDQPQAGAMTYDVIMQTLTGKHRLQAKRQEVGLNAVGAPTQIA